MEMFVHLDSDIFEKVKTGTKNVEVRVNDEKRRKLSVGDTLVFLKRPDDIEKLSSKITGLVYFNNFNDLVDNYPIERLYSKDYTKIELLNLLSKFYSEEEINKYGVVAIEFTLEE